MYRRVGVVLLLAFCLARTGVAQVSNSPFTQQGLGDLYGTYQPTSFGMGGIGISNGDVRYINTQNPALLVYNSIYTYSTGVIGESRNASDGSNTQKSGGMNLSHLGMSFPVKPGKWVSSIVLSPYSNVEYEYVSSGNIGESPFDEMQRGKQGLAQLEWANGFKIMDNLKFGAKAKYLFGSIQKESGNTLTGDNVNSSIVPTIFNRDAISGLLFGVGLQYQKKIKNQTYLNLGLVYDFQTKVKNKRLQTLETRNGVDIIVASDTIINSVKHNIIIVPSALGLGISVGQSLKWLAGIDVRLQNWSEFEDFGGSNTGMQNAMSVALGGEYTPDAGSIDKILKRVTYRLGASYQKTPYVVGGNGVNDFGINFGGSLPVGRISSLDMGFKFGKRGSLGNNQLNESYFQLQFGVTFNDRLWFIKRKYD